MSLPKQQATSISKMLLKHNFLNQSIRFFMLVSSGIVSPLVVAADNSQVLDLPTTTVVGVKESADGTVMGIAASRVSSTTGFDESALKSTQAVSVIGQQEISTTGAATVSQALDYTAGINTLEPADKTSSGYIIRGFNSPTAYRDGLKFQANQYNGEQELYGAERIEVVKGPNSVLAGTMPPGGAVNVISKKAKLTDAYEVGASVGNFNHKQLKADLNKKLNDTLAVRLVGVYKDSDSFVNHVPDDRTYIAPSLTWQPNPATKATLQADYTKINTKYLYGFPVKGTLEASEHGYIAQDTFAGIPSFDKYDNERISLGYEVSHKFSQNFSVQHKLAHLKTDLNFPSIGLDGPVDGQTRIFKRSAQKRQDNSEVLSTKLTGTYKWKAGEQINNVLLLGVDYSSQEHQTERYNSTDNTINTIDLYKPIHSQDKVDGTFTPSPYSSKSKSKQTGIFLQNQATINDKWVGLVGLRRDDAKSEQSAFFNPAIKQTGDYSATTARAGLVYLSDNGLAPYVSMNQSFEVQLGKDKEGNDFKPTKGTQYEAGIRYQPDNSDTLVTASVYRIDQTNVLVTDPDNKDFETQLGEVRSQGFELEAKTQLGDDAHLIAAYNYNDARTTKSSPTTPELDRKRLGNTPYNEWSLWGDYRFAGVLPKLTAGLGLRYTGGTLGFYNDADVPGYTLLDMMASYDVSDNIKLSLNAKNLTDRTYVVCSYACFYGEPAKVTGSIMYTF